MNFSNFGKRFTQPTPISQLMDDLGDALSSDTPVNMLGGGNPAQIDAVNTVFLHTYRALAGDLSSHDAISATQTQNKQAIHPNNTKAIETVTNYSNPQGDAGFIDTLVAFFNRHYDWGLTKENIALTNGSQNAFFYLFNLFAGQFSDDRQLNNNDGAKPTHKKSILLPLAPEYIGYSDVHIEGDAFVAIKPHIESVIYQGQSNFFKYRIDFAALENLPALKNGEIGAICCSRPTNPTGNVLTDDEMARLSAIAKHYDIPLIIDNAYGEPFPNLIQSDVRLTWNNNTILCFSLSKIGMPGLRTGIVVAHPKVVNAISSLNAVVNLAPTRFGGAIATPLLADDTLKHLCDDTIKPFYAKKAERAIGLLQQALGDTPMQIHKPEGAMFLWLWFKDLPISTTELYARLKAKHTLIVPGEYFFPGLDIDGYRHAHECIRMSIAGNDATLQAGIKVIGEVVKEAYANG